MNTQHQQSKTYKCSPAITIDWERAIAAELARLETKGVITFYQKEPKEVRIPNEKQRSGTDRATKIP